MLLYGLVEKPRLKEQWRAKSCLLHELNNLLKPKKTALNKLDHANNILTKADNTKSFCETDTQIVSTQCAFPTLEVDFHVATWVVE